MELELKHICPYIPYSPTVMRISKYGSGGTIESREFDEVQIEGIEDAATLFDSGGNPHWTAHLLLRPLSQLTQEITHNGETFVAIERLSEIAEPILTGQQFDDICHNLHIPSWVSMGRMPSWVRELLIEWHFDVFGLLENNLAIVKSN